jgi:hypothetical protein
MERQFSELQPDGEVKLVLPVERPPAVRAASGGVRSFLSKQRRSTRHPFAKDLFGGTQKSHTWDGCAPQKMQASGHYRTSDFF